MNISDICTIQTISCNRDETVQGAALLMRKPKAASGDAFLLPSR